MPKENPTGDFKLLCNLEFTRKEKTRRRGLLLGKRPKHVLSPVLCEESPAGAHVKKQSIWEKTEAAERRRLPTTDTLVVKAAFPGASFLLWQLTYRKRLLWQATEHSVPVN